jgi:hypothetical protein
MAASSEERDYVHVVERGVLAEHPTATFAICQVAEWERQYREGAVLYPKYAAARDLGADIIIVRCIENCSHKDFDAAAFKASLGDLISYLDKTGKAKLIVTTSFWPHPGDTALADFAAERGAPCVGLGDLGTDDRMKAIGLFEHRGVANHPGDLGMQKIAERILIPLLPLVREMYKYER